MAKLEINLNANFDDQMTNLRSDLNTNLDGKITDLNIKLDNHKLDLENKFDDFRRQMQSTCQHLESKMDTRVHRLSQQIDEVKSEHDNVKAELCEIRETQINQAVTVKSLQSEIDERIGQMLRETENRTQTANQQVTNHLKEHLESTRQLINDHTVETRTQILQKVNQDIGELNGEISKQRDEITQLSQSMKNNSISPPNHNLPIQIVCPGNNSNLNNLQIPKFNGRSANPNEFLNRLQKYYERSITHDIDSRNYAAHLHDVIEASLEGHASRWFLLIRTDVKNWESFVTEFHKKYWNRDVQRHIKTKVENETYRRDGKLSRSEFFTERALTLKALQPTPSEEEIITTLAECFDSLVRDAYNVQNITTIKDFVALLEREDMRDSQSRHRNERRYNLNPQNSETSRTNTIYQRNERPYDGNRPRPRGTEQPNPSRLSESRNRNYAPNTPNPKYHPYQGNQNHDYNHRQQNPRYPSTYHSQNQNQQRYPTTEQRQACAIIRQPPSPRNSNPPSPNRANHNDTYHNSNRRPSSPLPPRGEGSSDQTKN